MRKIGVDHNTPACLLSVSRQVLSSALSNTWVPPPAHFFSAPRPVPSSAIFSGECPWLAFFQCTDQACPLSSLQVSALATWFLSF